MIWLKYRYASCYLSVFCKNKKCELMLFLPFCSRLITFKIEIGIYNTNIIVVLGHHSNINKYLKKTIYEKNRYK